MHSVDDVVKDLSKFDCAPEAELIAEKAISKMYCAYSGDISAGSKADACSAVFDVLFSLEAKGYDVIPYLGRVLEIINSPRPYVHST